MVSSFSITRRGNEEQRRGEFPLTCRTKAKSSTKRDQAKKTEALQVEGAKPKGSCIDGRPRRGRGTRPSFVLRGPLTKWVGEEDVDELLREGSAMWKVLKKAIEELGPRVVDMRIMGNKIQDYVREIRRQQCGQLQSAEEDGSSIGQARAKRVKLLQKERFPVRVYTESEGAVIDFLAECRGYTLFVEDSVVIIEAYVDVRIHCDRCLSFSCLSEPCKKKRWDVPCRRCSQVGHMELMEDGSFCSDPLRCQDCDKEERKETAHRMKTRDCPIFR